MSRAGRIARHDIVLAVVAIVVVALLSGALSDYHVYVVTVVVIFTIIGASHVLLFGAAGQPSVGHAALIGVGVYTSIAVSRHLGGADIPVEVAGAVVVGALVGGLVGLPSLRIGSLYLAIATLALSVVGQQVFFQWTALTGGGAGTSIGPVRLFGTGLNALGLLYLALIVMAICLLVLRNLLRGRSGRAWNALRTSPRAASSVGIALGWHKVAAFAVAGGLVGAGGVLYGHAVTYVSPEDFSTDLSIITLVIAVIGGQRYLWGAALGALFVEGVPELLRGVGDWRNAIFGAIFICVMLFFPEGFSGGVRSAWRRWIGRRSAPPAVSIGSSGERSGGDPGRDPDGVGATPAPGGLRLSVEDLRVAFGGVEAVGGVSIDVAPGSVVGLVGPNGAGKTTLLDAVSGFVRPVAGSIRVDEHDLIHTPVHLRTRHGVARTFQNLSLHRGLTVLDHALIGLHASAGYGPASQLLRLPRYFRAERDIHHRAIGLLERLGLADVASDRVDNLPYGVQKRVDVTRALISSPRLLLLDEPVAGLTPQEGGELIDSVLAVTRETGTTVVLIEHNIDLVMRVADRVVALNFGKVIVDDRPDHVRVHDEFVKAYLGA